MKVHPTPELQELMPRLAAAGAMKEGHHLAAVEGRPDLQNFFVGGPQKSFPTAETWDYAKRGLDKVLQDVKPGAPGANPNLYRVYSGLKSDLMGALENHPDPTIGQVYRQARQNYAEPSGIMNALEEGQQWRGVHKDDLAHQLASKTTLERSAYLQGVRSDLDDMLMDSARGGNRISSFFEAPSNQEKLQTLLKHHPDPDIALTAAERAQALIQNMERQREFGQTKSSVTGNSATAGRIQAQRMMEGGEGTWASQLMERLHYSPHVTPAAYVPGLPSLKKAVGEEAMGRVSTAQSSAAELLTRQNPEAGATLRALQGYTVPGEASGPAMRDLINALVRGGAVEPQAREGAKRRAAPVGSMIAPIFR